LDFDRELGSCGIVDLDLGLFEKLIFLIVKAKVSELLREKADYVHQEAYFKRVNSIYF
jgi:hypothetical protein